MKPSHEISGLEKNLAHPLQHIYEAFPIENEMLPGIDRSIVAGINREKNLDRSKHLSKRDSSLTLKDDFARLTNSFGLRASLIRRGCRRDGIILHT